MRVISSLKLNLQPVLILLGSLLIGSIAIAEEVDDFYVPQFKPKDSAYILDSATDALLNELVDLLNRSQLPDCEDPQIYQLALKKLDQNFTAIGNGLRAGAELRELFENKIRDPMRKDFYEKRIQQILNTWLAEFPAEKKEWFAKLFAEIDYFGPHKNDDTIYNGMDFLTCCTSRINFNGIYFGIDKIDHFFGNAGLLLEQLLQFRRAGIPLPEALEKTMQISVRQEHSLWGLKGLSPKSYGDLSANWQGLHFYRRLFANKLLYYENQNLNSAYILCKEGKFTKNSDTTFHFADYVDEAWNESINCNSFINKKDYQHFQFNLKKAGLKCPLVPETCKTLVEKHKNDPLFVKYNLNPVCNGENPLFSGVEEALPISWDEVEQSFRGFTWPIIKDLLTMKTAELLQNLIPDFLKPQRSTAIAFNEGQSTFSKLLQCTRIQETSRHQCIQQFIEPGLSEAQVSKFSSILSEEYDFSPLQTCPIASEKLEANLHPTPIGDLSLCFKTHYRRQESLGRVYFRRHGEDLKVVLMRF